MAIKSSTGTMLEHAELFSRDADGKRFGPLEPGHRRLHETRQFSNLTHLTEREEQEETALREARAHALLEQLTPLEREILRLHEDRTLGSREVEQTVPASHLDVALANGWLLVRRTRHGSAVVVKSFPRQLTYSDIGEKMNLSARQVHRHIASAHRKLRSTRCAAHEPDAGGWAQKSATGPLRARCKHCNVVMRRSRPE